MAEGDSNANRNKSAETKNLFFGLAIYNSLSILGPLLFFGLIGYGLDKAFGTDPILLLACLGLSFAISNIFLFSKAISITKDLKDIGEQGTAKGWEEEDGESDGWNEPIGEEKKEDNK